MCTIGGAVEGIVVNPEVKRLSVTRIFSCSGECVYDEREECEREQDRGG